MIKPRVENKYGLKPADISSLIVHRDKIAPPLFWRNDIISAWCISATTAKSGADKLYGTYDTFWLGIYDEDAPRYKGKIRYSFGSYGDMCSYKFKKFYNEKEIENPLDLRIQEKALEILNELIDEGVLEIENGC